MSRKQRLTRSALFDETYGQGRCQRGRLMNLWLRSGEGAALRLGVVTSRRVGRAHFRTRARRLMREAFRLNRGRFHGDVDVILVARSTIVGVRRKDVEADLLALARRAGILKTEDRGQRTADHWPVAGQKEQEQEKR